MIQLRSDCLVFEVSGGDKIPCSVEKLTIEVLAESVEALDPEVVKQAAAAVLHYFKDDLGRETVTIEEFTGALEHVLRGLGYNVQSPEGVASAWPIKPPALPPNPEAPASSVAESEPGTDRPIRVVEVDLDALGAALGDGLEMDFFARLRGELRTRLADGPRLVRFHGLRSCAMRLARVRRWCPRSVEVSDQIVSYLRDCWGAEHPRKDCALLVN